MVSERSLAVLRAIVQDYVASREPVGSKTIVERHAFGVSAATIRNDMAVLEEEELIAAPHTSSGRIPTDKGYRVFVDQLADVRPLTSAQRQAIETFLGESTDLDELLARTVRLVSQLTKQLAVVQYPSFQRARVRHVELVSLAPTRVLCILISDTGQVEQRLAELDHPADDETLGRLRNRLNEVAAGLTMTDAATALSAETASADRAHAEVLRTLAATLADQAAFTRSDRLVVAGAANLVRTEQDFSGNILGVIEAIEEQVVILKLFGELASEDGITVRIGRENAAYGLGDTSVVSSSFEIPGRDVSRLGIVGPTRMDYSQSMAAVRAVARYLSRTLGER
ncbi:heat-inducible transcriptional repressor [Agromyces flavus]|uniref:Heat-inducible transcription repressor HrcA n=1 Tax=Agromyces flavus TaxID=589382 RepID=A0A1H1S3D8_9MICO|nr:heat-inducible transcriptional repressor HrcA [Agromyces flavus]MCP2368937.1 heat-inducible transcriptional repressor [Agromyces flavus]GGI48393.1 heat-inducible transcription repressor HrcA [Agromyces flavus]SDS42266.1 heat-inducible transcription repressor HrcA [Agromyces flavus]